MTLRIKSTQKWSLLTLIIAACLLNSQIFHASCFSPISSCGVARISPPPPNNDEVHNFHSFSHHYHHKFSHHEQLTNLWGAKSASTSSNNKIKEGNQDLSSISSSNTSPAVSPSSRIRQDRRRKRRTATTTALQATSSEDIKADHKKRRRRRKTKTTTTKSTKDDTKNGAATKSSTTSSSARNYMKGGGVARLSRAVAKASADRAQAMESSNANNSSSSSSSNNNNGGINSNTATDARGHKANTAGVQSESDLYISSISNSNKQSSSSSSQAPPQSSPYHENNHHHVGSLTELTRAIDEKLYANGPRGTDKGDYPKLDGIVQNARDNMTSLLGFNHMRGDWKTHSSQSTYNVAIVFGKRCIRDQVTVEYALRIKTLARLFKEEPEFRPSLVCFCGGMHPMNHVSDADCGYIYFRHLCAAEGIDLENVGIFIDSRSRSDEESAYHVTEEVKAKYISKWLEDSPSVKDGEGVGNDSSGNDDKRTAGRRGKEMKQVNLHFTIISTEYHLCNINDVHHRSPQRSLLTLLDTFGEDSRQTSSHQYGFSVPSGGGHTNHQQHESSYYNSQGGYFNGSNSNYGNHNGYNSHHNQRQSSYSRPKGIVQTSWSFQYATYPFIRGKDDAVVFLGKCYLLGEELMPLLVNMKGVVDQKEFFQRDNYLMLSSIRRSLVHHVEELHKPRRMLKTSLKVHARNIYLQNGGEASGVERDMSTVLEGALLSLGRCVDLVKPAGLLVSSVPKNDWMKALRALEHSMSEIRNLCDPDKPLKPSEWGRLVDDDAAKK